MKEGFLILMASIAGLAWVILASIWMTEWTHPGSEKTPESRKFFTRMAVGLTALCVWIIYFGDV